MRNESPGLPYGSPNLLDKNHFEWLFIFSKYFAPLRRLSRLKQLQFFKLVSPFLNAFLLLGFSEKHTLNESGCVFLGGGRVEWADNEKREVDC